MAFLLGNFSRNKISIEKNQKRKILTIKHLRVNTNKQRFIFFLNDID